MRLVLKSQACTPEKHRDFHPATDGLSAKDELVSTLREATHQSRLTMFQPSLPRKAMQDPGRNVLRYKGGGGVVLETSCYFKNAVVYSYK